METQTMTTGTKGRRAAKKKLDTAQYIAQHADFRNGLTMPGRIAHYLDWAAAEYPHIFTSHKDIFKAATGMLDPGMLPYMKAAIGRARKVLVRDYHRDIVTLPGIGARATVDDDDMLKHVLTRKGNRLVKAKDSFVATANMIDVKKISATEEMKPLAKWLNTDVRSVLKLIGTEDFHSRMLPPSSKEDEKDKK